MTTLLRFGKDRPSHSGEGLHIVLVVRNDLAGDLVSRLHASVEEAVDLERASSKELEQFEVILSINDASVKRINLSILLSIVIDAEGETSETADRNIPNDIVQADLHHRERMRLAISVLERVVTRVQIVPVRENQFVSRPEVDTSESTACVVEGFLVQSNEGSFLVDGFGSLDVSLFHDLHDINGFMCYFVRIAA